MAGLSYLDIVELEGGIYMGGLMTVNEMGIPTEFVYSKPIVPTQLQASMYGAALMEYLSLDVIGKGLVDASKTAGVPAVVGNLDLLQLATRVKRPLCRLTTTNMKPLGEVAAITEKQPGEVLAQLDESGCPHAFRFYDRVNFPVEQHINTFVDCCRKFDLLEPLRRVRSTLQLLSTGEGQSA